MSYTINTKSQFSQPWMTYPGAAGNSNAQSIVDAGAQSASSNQTVLTNGAADEAAKASLYAAIAGQLSSLDQSISGLKDAGLFAPSSVTTTDSSKVAVQCTNTAQTGQYVVNVSQLATNQINNSASFSSAQSAVETSSSASAPGSISIQIGSNAASVFNLTEATTLTSLASSINASGIAVEATVVNDSSGYHISLAGTSTGSSGAMTFAETNSSAAFGSTVVQAAQDAHGTVNGAAFDLQNNTDETLIPGVTITLGSVTAAPVTVSVTKNTAALATGVQQLVQNYNTAISCINAATAYASTTNLNNLISDSSIQNLTRQLEQAISQAPSSATGNYRTLASIGISYNLDNTLTLDTNALGEALAQDASSVANLLSTTSAGSGIAAAVDNIATTYGGPAGVLIQMSQAQSAIGTQDKQTAQDMQYAIDAQHATMQNQIVAFQTNMSDLQAQNMLVEALVDGVHVGKSGADMSPVYDGAEAAAVIPSNDGGAQVAGEPQEGINGYVPAL